MQDQSVSDCGENDPRVLRLLHSPPPPRPGASVAWGERDEATGLMGMWREDGLWFVFDPETGKDLPLPRLGPDEPFHVILHRQADSADTIAKCYFIGGDEGRIKIGYSVDVPGRLKALQCGSPIELRVLATAPGGFEREAAYHNQFADHRAYGEWFERHADILAEIERLKGDPS